MIAPHLIRGRAAERSVLRYLRARGLRLVERNYRCVVGELDLIMRERRQLVFVEVRYRRSEGFGGARASVDRVKQRKLRRAGEYFLRDYRHGYDNCRFDVVAVSGAAPYRIDWISNAFS